jgi:hypothetical protein
MKSIPYFICVFLVFNFLVACKKEHHNIPPTAEAGTAQTLTLPVDSVTLTGSGTDPDGHVVAYLWSEVSGPNTPVIANAATASISVNGLITGTYIFQLLVTDNQGATGTDTVSVLVNPAIIDTLSLQPSNNPNEIMLLNNNGLDNSSTNVEWPVEAWTNGGSFTIREIFKFDLSTIPTSAKIISANLQIYSDTLPTNGNLIDANFGASNSLLLEEVSQSWDPATVGWFNQPTISSNYIDTIPATTTNFLNLNIDVSKMVGDMVKNSNYGFLLRMQNETIYNSRIFCSSSYADAKRHPMLTIYYTK